MELDKLTIDRGPGPRRATRRSTKIVPIALLAAVLGGLYLAAPMIRQRLSAAPAEAPEVAVARAELVDLARARPATAGTESATSANGYVVARRRAALSADTPGRIVELNVEEGSVVSAGDVVARLYADEAEAAVRGAEADLAASRLAIDAAVASTNSARTRLTEARAAVDTARSQARETEVALGLGENEAKRATRLFEQGALPTEQRDRAVFGELQARARDEAARARVTRSEAAVSAADAEVQALEVAEAQARARVPAAEAALDRARAVLDKTFVRAPFDGVVVLKDAEVGEVVSPNALGGQSRGSVATMVDFSTLEVQVELPETILGSVTQDGAASVYFDAFPDERFPARVDRIWPTANRQKATIELRVVLDATDPRLRPEMGARVVFERPAADPEEPAVEDDNAADPELTLAVPRTAVVERDGVRGVFTLDGDTVLFQPVRTGASRGGRIAIVDGLEAGAEFAVRPGPDLRSGATVRRKR
ncbi:MAG: efflux RND transporter periplasmic adaptor subunit [Planctomycetota bacterium]